MIFFYRYWKKNSFTVRTLGKQFTQLWFNYEQPNFWVNNCQLSKIVAITQLLGNILANYPTVG